MNTASGKTMRISAAPAVNAILLVDDDAALLEIGKRMLKRMEYEVYTASGCREAVQLTRKHADNLICAIIDLSMPGTDGFGTCREVKAVKPDLRVIIASGYLKDQVEKQATDIIPDGYIQKPFQLSDLLDKLLDLKEPA